MRRILITGGAGFIGINLIDFFLRKGTYQLTIVDNLSVGNLPLLKKVAAQHGVQMVDSHEKNSPGLLFIKGDILDGRVIRDCLKDQDVVIHLAAQTGVIPSIEDPEQDAETNIMGTLSLLQAARNHKLSRFIFASSAAPLGDQTPPLDEQKVPQPLSPYGASKLAAEGYCSAFAGSYQLPVSIMRFSNVYGMYSFHKGSVVAHFIKQILSGQTLQVYGDGEQTRDFLFTHDLARAIELIIRHNTNLPLFNLFQLGTGVSYSINQLIQLLRQITKKSVNVDFLPPRDGEIVFSGTSIAKISRAIGYKPQYSLQDGIKQTWQWYLSES